MPKVLVYGGAGQLGEAVVHKFIEQGWEVVSVDFRPSSIATSSITLTGAPVAAEAESILSQLGSQHGQFDALINVAGGWAGGGIKVSRADRYLVDRDASMSNVGSSSSSSRRMRVCVSLEREHLRGRRYDVEVQRSIGRRVGAYRGCPAQGGLAARHDGRQVRSPILDHRDAAAIDRGGGASAGGGGPLRFNGA